MIKILRGSLEGKCQVVTLVSGAGGPLAAGACWSTSAAEAGPQTGPGAAGPALRLAALALPRLPSHPGRP
jgi:hypothetical protein